MSPESEQKLAKIYEVLMGDPINGKLGYFHTHNQIMEDMYGKGADGVELKGKKNTVLIRISTLEENSRRQWWTVTAVGATLIAIKMGVINLISKAFEK